MFGVRCSTFRSNRKLITEHEACEELIRPYLRGSDVGRWKLDWANLWMVALASSNDRAWPWAGLGERAEAEFKAQYVVAQLEDVHPSEGRGALPNGLHGGETSHRGIHRCHP